MKTQFAVPADSMFEFAEILSENQLSNEIVDTTKDDEILVDVEHGKEDFDAIEQLAELTEAGEEENEEDE